MVCGASDKAGGCFSLRVSFSFIDSKGNDAMSEVETSFSRCNLQGKKGASAIFHGWLVGCLKRMSSFFVSIVLSLLQREL